MIVWRVIRVLALLLVVAGCSGGVATDGRAGTRALQPAVSAPGAPERPVPEPVAVQVGPGDRKQIALTFDADMTPEMRERLDSGVVRTWYNEEVIDVLRNTGTPATLFLTGLWAQTYPDVARSLADDPRFEIANHSLEHKAFRPCYTLPVLREDEKQEAVIGSERVIEQITGVRPYYFRFPGGSVECATPDDIALVAAAGEQAVDWTAAGNAFQPDPRRSSTRSEGTSGRARSSLSNARLGRDEACAGHRRSNCHTHPTARGRGVRVRHPWPASPAVNLPAPLRPHRACGGCWPAGVPAAARVPLRGPVGDGAFQAGLGSAVLFNPERQADPAAIALGLAVLLLPYSLVDPFAGALLDRWDRRHVLVVANLLRAALIAAVAARWAPGWPVPRSTSGRCWSPGSAGSSSSASPPPSRGWCTRSTW